MTGRTASTARPSFQLIERSSTLAPRIRKTDDTSDADGLRDEQLDGVDVRREVGQQLGRRHLLDVGEILRRELRDELRPKIPAPRARTRTICAMFWR